MEEVYEMAIGTAHTEKLGQDIYRKSTRYGAMEVFASHH
jgi:hypothetical protein